MKGKKILIVEDDPDLLEMLRLTFHAQGYQVILAADGEDGLKLARRHGPDIMILDLMLPGIDGLEVCRQIRADPGLRSVPILMLTARSEETDVVLGLGMGADDYVTKPARPRELVARVHSLLRRSQGKEPTVTNKVIARGELVIDPIRFEVRMGDASAVRLTPTEFRLLQTLAGRPGRVFRRQELLDHAVGAGVVVTERTIDTHIKAVRQKLGEFSQVIETVRGVGYCFRDGVEVVPLAE
ncbi:MAG: DNA-binding response regulator [Planctomycetota bacterium]|nr:MAG: DNA-binding response regulator [Planctomycetota bacterium]